MLKCYYCLDITLTMNQTSNQDILSVCYHDIFDYPLNEIEIKRWVTGIKARKVYRIKNIKLNKVGNYITIKGREFLVNKSKKYTEYSNEKIKIAKNTASLIGKIPTVKLVALSGSLAMNSAKKNSDIDLMIITEKGTLWSTRAFVWVLLKIIKTPLRKPHEKKEKDKLCLNLWLDDSSMVWEKNKRNIYTAHEISQLKPLIDKKDTYIKLRRLNEWTYKYWPNSGEILAGKDGNLLKIHNNNEKMNDFLRLFFSRLLILTEPIFFQLQFLYMRNKVTNETISRNIALFHPNNMSDHVRNRLEKYCIN